MKGLCKNKGGFSLLEVVVSIALAGLVATPICSSIVLSHRMNAKSEAILQARLEVTAVVEELQANGYDPDSKEVYADKYGNVTITCNDDNEGDGYEITVQDKVEEGEEYLVTITTVVKAAPASSEEDVEEEMP